MRIFCLSIMLFFFVSHSAAQQLYFNHLSVNNGLTQGVNNCVFKDSKGFVWISSFDGLNRFDGLYCKRFYASATEKEGLKGTLFLNILEDQQTNLWIGSNEGLNLYDRINDLFNCYKIDIFSKGEQFCSPFYVDDKNHVWVQSGSGIYVFDPSTKKFTKKNNDIAGSSLLIKTIPQQLYQPVSKLLVIGNWSLFFWEGTVINGNIEWRKEELPLQKYATRAFLINKEDAWLGTDKGVYRFKWKAAAATFAKYPPAKEMDIFSLHFDDTGILWIGTFADGLFKLDPEKNTLQQYQAKADNNYSLAGNRIIYINTDNNRNLWVSVWGKGIDYANLDKFHFNQFISKAEAEKAGTDNFIRSVITVNNEIWCATQSGGIIVLDLDKKIKQVIKTGLPSTIESLCADSNTVWAATFNGMFAIQSITKQVRKMNFTGEDNYIISKQYNYVTVLHNGNLLLSSNAGLFIAVKNKDQYQIQAVKGLSTQDVYLTTYEDEQNQLYISKAFKGFGIYQLKDDSAVNVSQFPMQATIKCFSNTPDSIVWVGSTIGLIKFNKETKQVSRIYTTSEGLSNQYVYGIIQDKNYLWLSTNAGINRLDVKNDLVKIFSEADGLQSNEYNTYAFCKSNTGEIFFGGVNGINSFYPPSITALSSPPSLSLSSVQLNDTAYTDSKNYDALKNLGVKYDQNTLGFQFTVIDHVNAKDAHIRYMLEGYDKDWVTVANKSLIRYAKLPAGHYVLKVRAINADGIESKQQYQLPIVVNAPWWQQWWFWLLVAVFAGVSIFMVIKSYLKRRLQKQRIELEKELAVEQERIRMARELHDGLGSMLSGIKHSFSAIKNEINLSAEQENKFDYTISKLDDSIKDLRAVSHEMFSAELLEEGLEAAIKNYCNAISATTGIHILFENIIQQKASLKGEQAFHIFRIIQELIHNIVRHSKTAEAIVQLSYNNSTLTVTVEDSGQGFNTETIKTQQGIGLKNVESRIKILHGKLDIKSGEGKGTSVFIEVPVA